MVEMVLFPQIRYDTGHWPGKSFASMGKKSLGKRSKMSLLQNERRSEIERKIFWARMSGEIARKRSSATPQDDFTRKTPHRLFLADRSRCSFCKRLKWIVWGKRGEITDRAVSTCRFF